eukprot:TRINITY_DN13758_c0_g1_i1.p1 TRINITY_DN13758_c0_g1~~TRINITY_DN13758_c0_g1_i1.p1  ORF type:complete len:346 (-),score=61.22 TRINITY_DN13758_c0_g1_i1:303-1340(-)
MRWLWGAFLSLLPTAFALRLGDADAADEVAGANGTDWSELKRNCYWPKYAIKPFLPGRKTASSASSCQRKCQKEPACRGFTYYPRDGGCHFADDTAKPTTEWFGLEEVISGPQQCGKCLQRFLTLSPPLQGTEPGPVLDVNICMERCYTMPGCVLFAFNPADNQCSLHGANAQQELSERGVIGPRSCLSRAALAKRTSEKSDRRQRQVEKEFVLGCMQGDEGARTCCLADPSTYRSPSFGDYATSHKKLWETYGAEECKKFGWGGGSWSRCPAQKTCWAYVGKDKNPKNLKPCKEAAVRTWTDRKDQAGREWFKMQDCVAQEEEVAACLCADEYEVKAEQLIDLN